MPRVGFAPRRKHGRKSQILNGRTYTVLCDCNTTNPTPKFERGYVDDGTCRMCGELPWIDMRQHDA